MFKTCGSKHHGAKLNEKKVFAIRLSAETSIKLAKKYGVARSVLGYARRGDTWKHVPMPSIGFQTFIKLMRARKPRSKLTVEKVKLIRTDPRGPYIFGKLLKVHPTTIQMIRKHYTWKWVA